MDGAHPGWLLLHFELQSANWRQFSVADCRVARLGLGRIAASHHRSSASFQIR